MCSDLPISRLSDLGDLGASQTNWPNASRSGQLAKAATRRLRALGVSSRVEALLAGWPLLDLIQYKPDEGHAPSHLPDAPGMSL